MARIRSVKPEYWLDRKLARGLSRDARLLYIGLWNYADEHSRLHGDPSVIKGQIFPYDDDLMPKEIESLLDELAGLGRICLYDHEGDPFIFLPKLGKHQRLDTAKVESRLPEPPDPSTPPPDPKPPTSQAHSENGADRSEKIPDSSGNSAASLCGREQVAGGRLHGAGSREHVGREERGADQTAQTLVGEWLDHCASRPPGRVIGQISREIRIMLEEGQPYEKVRKGLALWQSKALHPSSLASCVFEASQPRPNKAAQRTSERLAIVRDLEELDRGEIA